MDHNTEAGTQFNFSRLCNSGNQDALGNLPLPGGSHLIEEELTSTLSKVELNGGTTCQRKNIP
jgi:hypothetical protein